MQIFNCHRKQWLATKVESPTTYWGRMRGLLGRPPLEHEAGMLFTACNWVHTFGMRIAIDVIFINRQRQVVALIPQLKPNRFSPLVWGANMTLEMASGSIAKSGVQIGDQLEFR